MYFKKLLYILFLILALNLSFFSTNKVNANTFFIYDKEGGTINYQANTTAKFRDTNGWYHIVVAWDTTDGTSTDRIKIYVNGVQDTDLEAGNGSSDESNRSLSYIK